VLATPSSILTMTAGSLYQRLRFASSIPWVIQILPAFIDVTHDPLKGKVLTLAAIAALAASAWWAREIAPFPGVTRWLTVPLALLLAAYLHLGYRGFRWVAGLTLLAAARSGRRPAVRSFSVAKSTAIR
jgi:hypothetical protein